MCWVPKITMENGPHITARRRRGSGPKWTPVLRTHYFGGEYTKTHSIGPPRGEVSNKMDFHSQSRGTSRSSPSRWGLERDGLSFSNEGGVSIDMKIRFRWTAALDTQTERGTGVGQDASQPTIITALIRAVPRPWGQRVSDSGCRGLYERSWRRRASGGVTALLVSYRAATITAPVRQFPQRTVPPELTKKN